MKRMISAVCLSLALVGCSQALPEVKPAPRVDATWPDPIKEYQAEWQVHEIDGQKWVGMPFTEFQDFRIWTNDILRYVQQSNNMICYYRAPLKEPKCQ